MNDMELARYQTEFVELLKETINNVHLFGIERDSTDGLLELHWEQLKAAYTNGYEDHAAVSNASIH